MKPEQVSMIYLEGAGCHSGNGHEDNPDGVKAQI
jgi:hypothetical protein